MEICVGNVKFFEGVIFRIWRGILCEKSLSPSPKLKHCDGSAKNDIFTDLWISLFTFFTEICPRNLESNISENFTVTIERAIFQEEAFLAKFLKQATFISMKPRDVFIFKFSRKLTIYQNRVEIALSVWSFFLLKILHQKNFYMQNSRQFYTTDVPF